MINRGLLLRSMREALGLTLLCALGLALFQALFAVLLPILSQDFSDQFLRMRISRFFLSAMLGTEIESVGPGLFAALAWVHPLQLTLAFAHAIASATRVPVGEIDRGTIDLLLGWPVSRSAVFLAEVFAFLITSAILVCGAFGGAQFGSWIGGASGQPSITSFFAVALNFYALILAIGGLAWLCSACADRRGRAIALPVALILVSMLVQFLAPVWEPARAFSFLSLLTYYQPMATFTRGTWPLAHLATLLIFAATSMALANAIFSRRDLRGA